MSIAPVFRQTKIGPKDHGRRMSLSKFAFAQATPGFQYELENGVVVAVDVPGIPHARAVQRVKEALFKFDAEQPGRIDLIAGGSDSVIRLPALESERYPDVAVYLTPPPSTDDQAWDQWTPEIVVEVVSRASARRDYSTKAMDYLAAGVREYWVVDPGNFTATIHLRRGDTWRKKKLARGGVIASALLPGFELRLASLFK